MPSSTNQKIRTPLGRARGLGSAKEGMHHWWMQRVTSVALLPVSIYLVCNLDFFTMRDSDRLIEYLAQPDINITLLIFVLCGFYHGSLGVQVIIEDYVHSAGARTALLLLNKLYFFFTGVTCIFMLLNIGYAG